MGLFGYVLTIIFVLTLYVGLHIYFPWRLIKLLGLRRRKLAYGLTAFAGVSIVLATGVGATSDNVLLQTYGRVFGLWAGLFLYLLLFLGVFEAVNAIRRLPSRPSLLAVAGLAVGVTAFGFWNGRQLDVVRREIPVPGLERPLSIVHVSDVHLGNWRGRDHLSRIVDEIERIRPDLVLWNGDFVDGRAALRPAVFAPLKRVKCPMFFTAGNHDIYTGRARTEALLRAHHVIPLRNDVVRIRGIQLVGLDYLRADDRTYDPHGTSQETLERVMPRIKARLQPGRPVVVVHHSPIGIPYIREAGAQVLLAGHTHGGQLFPWTLVAGLQFPYTAGLHRDGGMRVYVSRGAGTFGPPLRVGTRNEISHLVLVPAKGADAARRRAPAAR